MLHLAPDASTCGTLFNFIADSSLSPHQAAFSNLGSRSVVLGKQCHTPRCPIRAFFQWKSSVGAVTFWVPLSLEKGQQRWWGSFYFFWSLSPSDSVSGLPPPSHWVFDFQRQGFVHPWDEIQAFPWLFEAATPRVYLVSSLLHVCPSAILTPAALLTVLSAQVCCTSCPQAHRPFQGSPLCLTQVLASQESFPSMSSLSPSLLTPLGACCSGEMEVWVAEPWWQQLAP